MDPHFNQDDIARLAYQLWLERGCPEGSPHVDWERATHLLTLGGSEESPTSAIEAVNDESTEIDALSTGLAANMPTDPEREPGDANVQVDFDSTAENLPEGTDLLAPGPVKTPRRRSSRPRGPRTKS